MLRLIFSDMHTMFKDFVWNDLDFLIVYSDTNYYYKGERAAMSGASAATKVRGEAQTVLVFFPLCTSTEPLFLLSVLGTLSRNCRDRK